LLAGLEIFEESIHPIVYGRVGGASHRSSEKLMAVKNLDFTHGCWIHGVGEKGHPGLRKTVFSIPDLLANFATVEWGAGRCDRDETDSIVVVVGPRRVTMGVSVPSGV
jgi:hypothetical protein